jgi:hypothetical protein
VISFIFSIVSLLLFRRPAGDRLSELIPQIYVPYLSGGLLRIIRLQKENSSFWWTLSRAFRFLMFSVHFER